MENRQKILFTIFTISHGNGGHFYSLTTTALALSKRMDVVLVNFGQNRSPVVDGSGLKVYNIETKWNKIFRAYRQFEKIISEEKPSVLHSFCILSYFFVRFFSIKHSTKRILTKCGGPNPKKYFPFCENLILYSYENLEFFRNGKKFKKTLLHLIPNRVVDSSIDYSRINELKGYLKINESTKIFLRIGRIAEHYKSTILQSIALVEELSRIGYDCTLILIGSIQDKSLYQNLTKNDNNRIIIISDPKFTTNAVEIIDVADFIIGTGRSLMEAASKGKILLTPVNGSKYPVLVDNTNFIPLMESNFSPRGKVYQELNETVNKIISRTNSLAELSAFSRDMYEKYFDLEKKIDDYLKLYSSLEKKKESVSFDILLHLLMLLNHIRRS